MSSLTLRYDPRKPVGTVTLPLSKSMAARVAVVGWLAGTAAAVREWPDCDDVRHLLEALDTLNGKGFVRVDIGSGAAPMRFFMAVAAATEGVEVELDCSEQLRRRPIVPLVEALRSLGADIAYTGVQGYAPLLIRGRRLKGGSVEVPASVSSQFASALMMIGPVCRDGVEVKFAGRPVSLPYIEMTAQVMRMYGINPVIESGCIRVAPGRYTAPDDVTVEPDWSAASYFYARALLGQGDIKIERLVAPLHSIQGDAVCEPLFRCLGVATEWLPDGGAVLHPDLAKTDALRRNAVEIDLDMGAAPDLVPALATALCGAGIPYRLHGIAHLNHKECNRIAALSEELARMGWLVEPGPASLQWRGRRCPAADNDPVLTYGDHRMAMAFAPLACRAPWITIAQPEVVAKSFPGFWQEMEKTGIS